jgi:16S rRNA (cytosine967-C5)-methyltransferase
MERHRHNLPEWLVAAAERPTGRRLLAAGGCTLGQSAPLDLRVNALTAKRAEVQKELKQAGIAGRAHAVFALGPAH